MRLETAWISIFLFLVAICPHVAQGEEPGPGTLTEQWTSRYTKSVLENWSKRIQRIHQMVQDDKSKRALIEADRLAAEMVSRIRSGDSGNLLGTLNVLRALAAFDTGDERLALWHWHIALQMFPELADYKLDTYGDAGHFLQDHPFKGPDHTESSAFVRAVSGEVTPPRKTRAPSPQFPRAKRGTLSAGSVAVIVQVIIDKDGRPRNPVILKADGEFTMVCSSLEALWRWRFKPAELHGEPTSVWYNIIVTFRQ